MLLAAAVAIGVGGYLYLRLDDEIRRQVEQRIAEQYPQLTVNVGRARFEQDRGIAIFDVTIADKKSSEAGEPLLAIDEMYLAGEMRVEELLTSNLPIHEVVVRRATMRATRQADGSWNAKCLLPVPSIGVQPVPLQIRDATLILADATRPGIKQTFKGIQLSLKPAISNAVAGDEKRYQVEGTITGLPARELRFTGELNPNNADLNLTITASGLEVTSDLIASLPALPSNLLAGTEIAGRADATVHITRSGQNSPLGWSADVRFAHGRFNHPLLPDAFTDIAFTATATPERLLFQRLDARFGTATIALAAERVGWTQEAPIAMAAKVVGLHLDDRLTAHMPDSMARIWQRFRPYGLVDAEVRLNFDGSKWQPELVATVRDISLTDAERFPYVVEHAAGTLKYLPARKAKPDSLTLDLTGIVGGQPVKIEADLKHVAPREPDGVITETGVAQKTPGQQANVRLAGYRGGTAFPRPHPVGFVRLAGNDIRLHEDLVAAIPGSGQSLVRQLQPQGAVDFEFRSEWKELSQPRADVSLDIRLKSCAVRYVPFPLPLRNVSGLVSARNWNWKLQDIQGYGLNDSAVVQCGGEVVPRDGRWQADLLFHATDLPLDDNLKSALSPAGQQAWNELRPQGRVDMVARVLHDSNQAKPRVAVTLRPRERSVSLEMAKFPYRLSEVEGEATYQPGRVEIRKVFARHDREKFSAESGVWTASQDGGWQLALSGLNIDRLTPHRELVAALPSRLQAAIERLQPEGSFGVYNSSLNFSKPPNSEQVAAVWDFNIDCHQAVLRGGMPMQSVTGGFHLFGRDDGKVAYAAGELDFHSVVWKDIQLTNVRGPFWVDSTMCFLGEQALMKLAQPPRRVTADAYGGSLAANVDIRHDDKPGFQVELALGAGNLARFANERLGGPSDMNGTVSGKLVLAGTGQSTQSLSGSGELHVVDANIYELPVLVSMLKVLRNRTPNTTAFNRCDMQFTIQGEHVYFQQLNLLGDAVSLHGKGQTGFDRSLDLVFYTLLEPANLPIPLWKTVAGQLSKQTLQLNVVGTWDKAEVQPETLPGVNQVLEQIQTEFQGATSSAPSTATRDPFAPR